MQMPKQENPYMELMHYQVPVIFHVSKASRVKIASKTLELWGLFGMGSHLKIVIIGGKTFT